MVDGQYNDDYEAQDKAQDKGEGLLQALPLVSDTLVGCRQWNNEHSQNNEVKHAENGLKRQKVSKTGL